MKLIDEGREQEAVFEILRSNIRLPQDSMGDLRAATAACSVGEARLHGLLERYGRSAVLAAMAGLLDHGEAMIAAELRKLPQGVFEAEDWIDDDGLSDEPLKVRVRIEISEDRFLVDFSGSAPQALGPINNSRTGLVSAVRTIFKALTNPQIPANGGCFRALEVVCPDETVFTARRPAPVSTYWETMLYAEDLIWKALAELVPDRLTAGHVLSVCAIIIAGDHADTGEPTILVCPLVGGWGAMHNRDGLNGQFSVADGETYNIPVEITEARYGVHVEEYAFHNEPGGEGRHRGGKGVVLAYRIRSESATFTGSFGRFRFPPWGVAGGRNGSRNYVEIVRQGQRSDPPEIYGKAARLPLRRGDIVRCVTATGGGWGRPEDRLPESIAEDLRNGFVTEEQASSYGA